MEKVHLKLLDVFDLGDDANATTSNPTLQIEKLRPVDNIKIAKNIDKTEEADIKTKRDVEFNDYDKHDTIKKINKVIFRYSYIKIWIRRIILIINY